MRTGWRLFSRGSLIGLAVLFGVVTRGETASLSGKQLPDGFDILLLVDDSWSMGTPGMTGEHSDVLGRRIYVTNLLQSAFFAISAHAKAALNRDLNTRLAIVRFGTRAETVLGWTEISANLPRPPFRGLVPENRGWTDFDAAFRQSARLLDTRPPVGGSERRKTVIILVTDGEPSIAARQEGLGQDPAFWDGLDRDYLAPLRARNSDLELFVVAFNNPVDDFWPKVEPYWTRLGAIGVPIPGTGNENVYPILERDIIERLYPSGISSVVDGRFQVACYQSKLLVNFFFVDERWNPVLIAPNGDEIVGREQPDFEQDPTFARFSVANPIPGEWRVKNYQSKFGHVSYTRLPFDLSFVTPIGRIFPRLPGPIEMTVRGEGRDGPTALPAGPSLACHESLSGEVILRTDLGEESLPLGFTKTTFGVDALSQGNWAPPAGVDEVGVRVVLRSDDATVLSSPESIFPVSQSVLYWLDSGTTSMETERSMGRVDLRVQFREETRGGPLKPVSDVFEDPDRAIVARVVCPTAQDCQPRWAKDGTPVGGAGSVVSATDPRLSYEVPLSMASDPLSLEAQLILDPVLPEENILDWLPRLLDGQGGELEVRWEANPAAALKKNSVLAGRVAQP